MSDPDDPVILFLHIPKAAGTAFKAWLFDQLSDGTGRRGRWFNSGILYYPSGYIMPPDAKGLEEVATHLERDDLRAVFGHFQYGVHRSLRRPYTYITVLRHPVERIISLYSFQRLVEEREGSLELVKLPDEMDLEGFVSHPPYPEVDNGQTRRIAGLTDPSVPCTVKTLETALNHLERDFSLVGLVERMAETVELIRRRFGIVIKDQPDWKYNTNPARPDRAALSNATIDLICQKNRFDIALYEYVFERFENDSQRDAASMQRSPRLIRDGNPPIDTG